MLIQIKEKSFEKEQNKFVAEIIFDHSNLFEVEIENAFNEEEIELEWYFEEYIKEPYIAESKIQKSKDYIFTYGKNLFKILFSENRIYGFYKNSVSSNSKGFENIHIEIIAKSPEFVSIHWETLFDPDFDKPLSVLGTIFSRKNLKYKPFEAKVNSFPFINLLIVTARPKEENDVNYRTIQRPLIELIEKSQIRIKPYILRPGTFESLVRHLDEVGAGFYHIIHFDLHGAVLSYRDLERERNKHSVNFENFDFKLNSFQVRWGLYDLKPYDDKKAFLFFETEQKGIATPVSAEEIANTLQTKNIPVCILNACQSAKQDNTSNETNLASILSNSGIQSVIAMRYSVSVTGAEIFMKKLYNSILNNIDVEKAISLGRKELFYNKNRNANYGETIELEDWVLPIVFQNKRVDFNLREFNDHIEEENFYKNLIKSRHAIKDFYGRDLDILKIEKLLSKHNHLFIQGIGGIGKTTFLKYLSNWWHDTNFVTNTIFIDLQIINPYSFDKIIEELKNVVIPENEHSNFISKSVIVQKGILQEKLIGQKFLIVFDHCELIQDTIPVRQVLTEVEQHELIAFLTPVQNSFIIYSSRGSSTWIDQLANNNSYNLKGIDEATTYQFLDSLLPRNFDKQLFIDFGFRTKISNQIGNPLGIKLIASELINNKTAINSFIKTIEYVWDSFTGFEKQFFTTLFFFRKYVNMYFLGETYNLYVSAIDEKYKDKLMITDFTGVEKHYREVFQITNFSDFGKKLINAGIIGKDTDENYHKYLLINPLLSIFLQLKFSEEQLLESLLHFSEIYFGYGKELANLMLSKETEKERNGLFHTEHDLNNFLNGIDINLLQGNSVWGHYFPVDTYLRIKDKHSDRLYLVNKILSNMEEYPIEVRNSEFEQVYIPLLYNRGAIYVKLGEMEQAKQNYIFAADKFEDSKNKELLLTYGARIYNDLGTHYSQEKEVENARFYLLKAKEYGTLCNDKFILAKVEQALATLERGLRESSAYQKYFSALNMYKEQNDLRNQVYTLIDLGKLSYQNKDTNACKDFLNQAMDISQKTTISDSWIAEIYLTLGVAYFSEETDNSKKYLKLALDFFLNQKQYDHLINITYHLGLIAKKEKRIDEAMDYFNRVIGYSNNVKYEKHETHLFIAFSYIKSAEILIDEQQFEQSEKLLNKAISIFEDQNIMSGKYKCFQSLGALYYKWEEFEKSLVAYHQGIVILKAHDPQEYFDAGAMLQNMGTILHEQYKEDDFALTVYRQAKKCFEITSPTPELVNHILNIGFLISNITGEPEQIF